MRANKKISNNFFIRKKVTNLILTRACIKNQFKYTELLQKKMKIKIIKILKKIKTKHHINFGARNDQKNATSFAIVIQFFSIF